MIRLQKMSKMGKYVETGSLYVVAQGWGNGGTGTAKGYRAFFEVMNML